MEISDIFIYPIKSLGGISVTEATIEERGLRFDRRWMLVDEKGVFLTQRAFPSMATLKISLENDCLRVSDAENAEIAIPLAVSADVKSRVKIWSSKVSARLYDDQINHWFSERLATKCRLALMPEETRRKVNPFYAIRKFQDVVSFADAYPFMLIGENSLGDLNARLKNPVPMNRFRPNLVARGTEAFAEDGWKQIKIGETLFHVVKPCARCVMTTIDQQRGEFDGQEPLKTLSTYRLVKRGGQSKVNFGQNLIAADFGAELRVGDRIEVLKSR